MSPIQLRNLADIAAARLANQGLIGGGGAFASPADAVGWLGAAQAQDFAMAKWAVGLRVKGATDADIEWAFNAGEILRTHIMRPTWHFVLPRDIRSLLALTAARVHAANASQYRKLELDGKTLARSRAIIGKALRGGNFLTRAELGERLAQAGISTAGNRMAYVMMHAELEGFVCSGPRRGKQFTYALLDERAPREAKISRDENLAAWTLRFFTSHGPAQAKDFAWWAGLTLQEARRGLEIAGAELASAEIGGKTHWFALKMKIPKIKSPAALLLSIFDEYTIAYRDRAVICPVGRVEKFLTMGLTVTAVLILKGQLAGTWRREIRKGAIAMTVKPFQAMKRNEREEVEKAAVKYGEFMGMRVRIAME